MFKYKFILCCMFSFLITSSSYSHISKSKQIYYEQNKVDFLDDFFVNKIDKTKSNYDLIPKGVVLTPTLAAIWISIYCSIEANKIDKEMIISLLLANIPVTILVYAIFYDFLKDLVQNKSLNDKIISNLKLFLDKYNPNLNLSLDMNYKKLIPEEYYDVFDSLYNEYNSKGDIILKDAIDIVNNIRSKIKYDIKPKKYKKPKVVNINRTSYVNDIPSCFKYDWTLKK